MADEHAKVSNHIIESLHRLINQTDDSDGGPSPHLFLQLDNCWRENKNRFFMAFVECLIAWKLFKTIEVGFLPIGYTHSDIDQTFSTTYRRLRTENSITMEDLHGLFGGCYNKFTTVSSLQ